MFFAFMWSYIIGHQSDVAFSTDRRLKISFLQFRYLFDNLVDSIHDCDGSAAAVPATPSWSDYSLTIQMAVRFTVFLSNATSHCFCNSQPTFPSLPYSLLLVFTLRPPSVRAIHNACLWIASVPRNHTGYFSVSMPLQNSEVIAWDNS